MQQAKGEVVGGSCPHTVTYSYSEVSAVGAVTLSGARRCVECSDVLLPKRTAPKPDWVGTDDDSD